MKTKIALAIKRFCKPSLPTGKNSEVHDDVAAITRMAESQPDVMY
jgi:hypothetical protein